ncbi:hypothetical protein ACI79J_14090 [Geodermatophilus sp. SYSU D01062]
MVAGRIRSNVLEKRAVVTFGGLVAVSVTLTACGQGRSVEAYCDVFYGEGQELRDAWTQAGNTDDPLAGMAAMFSAPRDLATFFGRLAEVAPDEIEPDVAALHDAFQEQADSLGSQAGELMDNPLGALAGAFAAGLSTSGAEQRVNQYTLDNCGPPPTN